MIALDRFGLDVLLALVVGLVFVIEGITKLPAPAEAGRRAVVGASAGGRVLRRIRGVLEILGGLAVVAGAILAVIGMRVGYPGVVLGLVLAGLAGWTAAEAVVRGRWLRAILAVAAFALAVFYAGFRG